MALGGVEVSHLPSYALILGTPLAQLVIFGEFWTWGGIAYGGCVCVCRV